MPDGRIGKQRRSLNGGATKGTWNSLSVLVRGRHCECYRDGKLVVKYDDISPKNLLGQVGVYAARNGPFSQAPRDRSQRQCPLRWPARIAGDQNGGRQVTAIALWDRSTGVALRRV